MPDFATTKNGIVYAVRGTPGYEVAFEGLSKKDKEYLRAQNDGAGYTFTADRKSRAERIKQAAERVSFHGGFPLTREAQQARTDRLDKPRHRRKLY